MSQQGSWHQVFDVLSHSAVIWDEEPQQLDGEMDDLLKCNHTMFKAAVLSTSDAPKVLDEMPSVVLWDEDRRPELHMNSDLLQQLAQGSNYSVGKEKKLNGEPLAFDVLTQVNGSSCRLELGIEAVHEFDEIHLEDNRATMPEYAQFTDPATLQGTIHEVFHEILIGTVVWDDDSQQNHNSHDSLLHEFYCHKELVQQEASFDECLHVDGKATTNLLTNTADKLFIDLPHEVVWDEEMSSNIIMHSGLLQQLAFGSKGTYDTTAQPTQSDINTHGVLEQLALGVEYMAKTKPTAEFSDEVEVDQVLNGTLDVVSDVHACAPAIELFTHDLTNVRILPLFLELDVYSAGNMFKGMLNSDMSKGILVGVNKLYQPSTRCVTRESVKLHLTAQIDNVKAILSYDNLSNLVAHGERSVGMDSKTVSELVNLKLLMATKDSPGELIDEKHCMDVIWDEESHHGFDSHGIMQQIAQGINDQMHDKHIDFKTFVLSDHDTLSVLSKNHWTDILRSIVEFDVNEALVMGSECLNDEKIIFDANIDLDKLKMDGLNNCKELQVYLDNGEVCAELHIRVVWDSKMQSDMEKYEILVQIQNYVLHPSLCLRKCSGVQNSMFQSFASFGHAYLFSLQTHYCDLHHGEMQKSIAEDFLGGVLTDVSSSPLCMGSSKPQLACGKTYLDDEKNELTVWLGDDKVLTLVGDSSRSPKVGMVDANHGLDVVAFGPESSKLFNEAGKNLHAEEHVLVLCFAGGVQGICAQYVIDERPPWRRSAFSPGNDEITTASSVFHQKPSSNSNDFSPWSSDWFSIVGLQKFQYSDHSNHQTTVVSRMLCSGCLNVPWDPGGNHICFIPAIAWGQAMFCGGGNVIPHTI